MCLLEKIKNKLINYSRGKNEIVELIISFLFIAVFLSFTNMACSLQIGGSESISIPIGACNFFGTWLQCSQQGSQSVQTRITVSQTQMQIEIKKYGNITCSDSPFYTSNNITATWVGGSSSAMVINGYNLDISPDSISDLGCGMGNSIYTTFKFEPSCTGFYYADISTLTGCSSSVRATSLGTYLFNQQ